MKRYVLFFVISVFISGLYAQNQDKDNARKQKWEEMKAKRAAFYTERIGLTPEEAQVFWPVYNELQDKKEKLHQLTCDQFKNAKNETKGCKTVDYTKAMDKMINLRVQEAELEKIYHSKFKKIISPDKLFKYYRAERDWASKLLKDIEKRGDR